MTLNTEIHQKQFKNEFQKASINLIFTSNWLNEQMKHIFDRVDITAQQFNILRILRGAAEPLSTLQIRQRMLDKMSDTSRIVDRMIIKGLVKKVICTTDKRLVDITISEKGTELLARLDTFQSELDGVLKALSEDEAIVLNRLLDKVRGSE